MRCRESLENGNEERELEIGEQKQVQGEPKRSEQRWETDVETTDTLNGKPKPRETGRQKGKGGWETEKDQETDEMMKS